MKKEKLQSEIKKMKELHDLSNKKKKLEQDLQIISFQITNKTRKESEQIKFIEETERLQKRLVQTQLAIIGTTLAITLIIYLLNSSNSDKTQLTVIYGTESGQRSLSKRHTVDTSSGSYSAGNIVLHSGSEPFVTCNITFASHTIV